MAAPAPLKVDCRPLTDPATLATDWQSLESRADTSVFLSWLWIGVWLSVYKPSVSVLRVTRGALLVGLALISITPERRHGLLVSRCLRLHQTGQESQDQIWIEYNGFLAATGEESPVGVAAMDYLQQKKSCEWDELILGATDTNYANKLASVSALVAHTRWHAPCYSVNLGSLSSIQNPSEGDDQDGQARTQAYLNGYLKTLSSNTRHQIRRTHRLYEQEGTVRLERPQSLEQALEWFDRIGPAHRERWGTGSGQSGFANPDFLAFHRAMIRSHWASGGVDLIRVAAGEQTIARFYNLTYRNRVYFYLGGLKSEPDNRLKPGLLGHSLCIADYAARGFALYDFMGGDDRYKAQLGVQHGELVQVALQRDRLKLRFERLARVIKHRWVMREVEDVRRERGAG